MRRTTAIIAGATISFAFCYCTRHLHDSRSLAVPSVQPSISAAGSGQAPRKADRANTHHDGVPPENCESVSDEQACLPSWPWITRTELSAETLQAIESPKAATCQIPVRGTIRRIRESLFMDGLVEPAGDYDADEPEPPDLVSFRCAPTLLWPRIVGGPKETISGFSSVVPGAPEQGIPHFVVWAPVEQSGAKDQLLTLEERTLEATPILLAKAGERFFLLGRYGNHAVVLVRPGSLELRLVDKTGAVHATTRIAESGPRILEDMSGEVRAELLEPVGAKQLLLMLDKLYLVTIEDSSIKSQPLANLGSISRSSGRVYLGVTEQKCIDATAVLARPLATNSLLTPQDFETAPKLPCPQPSDELPWYEYLPLPVNGVRQPFVASVSGCLVRSALRLPIAGATLLGELVQDSADLNSDGPFITRQDVRLAINRFPLDPDLKVDLRFSGGRFRFGVGDHLPRYNDRHLLFRVAIPPHAIEQIQPGGAHADRVIKLRYPGKGTNAFPTWPMDCHEGSLVFWTNHTVTPFYLMYGNCE